MSNKYLLKIATTIDVGPDGDVERIHDNGEHEARARKAKLLNKPKMNKYLKGALIGGTVAKAGLTAYAVKKVYDKHKAKKQEQLKTAAMNIKSSQGEPSASINAGAGKEALQTGTAVGLGMAGAKLYEGLAPRAAAKFGKLGRFGALAGSTLVADYATVKANNSIASQKPGLGTPSNGGGFVS